MDLVVSSLFIRSHRFTPRSLEIEHEKYLAYYLVCFTVPYDSRALNQRNAKEQTTTKKKSVKAEAEDWTQLKMTVMNLIELSGDHVSVRGTNAALLHIENTK